MINKHFSTSSPSGVFVWTAVFMFTFVAHACAQEYASEASTLGEMFCNAYANLKPFARLFEWSAYVCGAALGLHGVHQMRLHTENPHNAPISRAIMLWFGAACLLALPEAAGTVLDTIYGTPATQSYVDCKPQSSAGGGSSLDEMMVNFVKNIKNPIINFVSMVAIVAGLYMIIRGLNKAARYGFDPKANSVHSIMVNIIFGALLMTIGDNLDLVMDSVFGVTQDNMGGESAISWSLATELAGGASDQFIATVTACLSFVQIVGVIAFVRGWFILKKVVEGGQGMGQGVTHVIGGVLAINIYTFLKIMDTTFGTGML